MPRKSFLFGLYVVILVLSGFGGVGFLAVTAEVTKVTIKVGH